MTGKKAQREEGALNYLGTTIKNKVLPPPLIK
jgi:hypothetical protein